MRKNVLCHNNELVIRILFLEQGNYCNMNYCQFNPHPALKNYIDAYWIVTGQHMEYQTEKILPDGCVDIIFNLGGDCKTDNGNLTMQNEKVYLVGTMTTFKETSINNETKLVGIRFKPGAFSLFYKFGSLHDITDLTIEFDKSLSPDIYKVAQFSPSYLDHFFSRKLTKQRHSLLPIITEIQDHNGQQIVRTLAQNHFTTVRQLERNFKQQIGISPKEFLNIVRYKFALSKIEDNTAGKSLSEIAFECGYYDHSHLTNELKLYTGAPPSQF